MRFVKLFVVIVTSFVMGKKGAAATSSAKTTLKEEPSLPIAHESNGIVHYGACA